MIFQKPCSSIFKENCQFSRQIEKSSTFQDNSQIQALVKVCGNHVSTFHIPGQCQPQSPSVEVVPDNNLSLSANILNPTMDRLLHWCHVNMCCLVMCAYCAYITICCTLGNICFGSRHFVNKVSAQHFSTENKEEAARILSSRFADELVTSYERSNQSLTLGIYLPKFRVNFSLADAEMNLAGNYRTLRGLRTVNPVGLPSTTSNDDWFVPREGTHSMKVTTYDPPFRPPFYRSLGNLYSFDPYIWAKMRKMSYFDHYFLAKFIVSTPPPPTFWTSVTFRVKGRCWASLSETETPPPPRGLLNIAIWSV